MNGKSPPDKVTLAVRGGYRGYPTVDCLVATLRETCTAPLLRHHVGFRTRSRSRMPRA